MKVYVKCSCSRKWINCNQEGDFFGTCDSCRENFERIEPVSYASHSPRIIELAKEQENEYPPTVKITLGSFYSTGGDTTLENAYKMISYWRKLGTDEEYVKECEHCGKMT